MRVIRNQASGTCGCKCNGISKNCMASNICNDFHMNEIEKTENKKQKCKNYYLTYHVNRELLLLPGFYFRPTMYCILVLTSKHFSCIFLI